VLYKFFIYKNMEQKCGCASFGNNFNKAKPYLLTVGLQFGFAGAYIFSVASLNRGMNRYVFVVYRNAIAALALAPFALIFERSNLNYYIHAVLVLCFLKHFGILVHDEVLKLVWWLQFCRKIRPKITLPVFLQIMALGFVE